MQIRNRILNSVVVAPFLLATLISAAEAAKVTLQPVVQDTFNYNLGTLEGQGGWTSYANGQNFIVQQQVSHSRKKAAFVNALADSVITKAGTPRADGRQTVFVRTQNRANWGFYEDGNAQFRVLKGGWGGSETRNFAAVSFKSDGHVAYYDPVADDYINFATYRDGRWTRLQVEWRSNDAKARYRVNNGPWTDWKPIAGSGTFTDFDGVGFDFFLPSGSGGAYYDDLQ